MTTAFNVLFVLALFAPPLTLISGIVVFALGVMTQGWKPAIPVVREAPRAA
jgi:hypothetical protein